MRGFQVFSFQRRRFLKTITLGAAAVQFGCLSGSLERLAFSYVDENDEETKAAKIARTFPDSFRRSFPTIRQ